MKAKTLKLTAFLLIFAGAFTACNGKEYPFLSVDKTSITVPAESGTFTILVSSNGEWTAVVQDVENHSWLTLANASGINDGIITVNIAENPYLETRSATIKISMGSLSEIVLVEQKITLANTQWQWIGIVDVETGELVHEPQHIAFCGDRCFTLEFITGDRDRNVRGFSTNNMLIGYYAADYKTREINIVVWRFTYVMEPPDGFLYVHVLNVVQFFSLKETELRLYFNDGENYLLFKPWQL